MDGLLVEQRDDKLRDAAQALRISGPGQARTTRSMIGEDQGVFTPVDFLYQALRAVDQVIEDFACN
ncbi:MAG TPA: hypothetical protein VHY21_06600 [Pseudonocardiaceae bacterium]|jgi:hypothetical protein|nr:hypothetical protein [Pseudonocardiaceae bacterium]